MVNNESELFEKIQFFANNKDQADKIGKNARNAVSKKAGASRKHANIITNILQNRAVNQKSKCGT